MSKFKTSVSIILGVVVTKINLHISNDFREIKKQFIFPFVPSHLHIVIQIFSVSVIERYSFPFDEILLSCCLRLLIVWTNCGYWFCWKLYLIWLLKHFFYLAKRRTRSRSSSSEFKFENRSENWKKKFFVLLLNTQKPFWGKCSSKMPSIRAPAARKATTLSVTFLFRTALASHVLYVYSTFDVFFTLFVSFWWM